MSLYLQWRFEEAEAAVAAARALPDALVDADAIAGCLLERRGDFDQADGLFERAAAAAPDKYAVPVRLSREQFDAEVQEAIQLLPMQFQGYLEGVSVVVQDLPDDAFGGLNGELGHDLSPDMLGLFDGVPLPEQDSNGDQEFDVSATASGNAIFLFQRNLERMANGRDDLVDQIRITLWHELGHYLGFEEGDMERLGLD